MNLVFKRAVILSTALVGISYLTTSSAIAGCTHTDGVGVVCDSTGGADDGIEINADSVRLYDRTSGNSGITGYAAPTTGNATVYSGTIDADSSGDELYLTGITVNGDALTNDPLGTVTASIFGGRGGDDIVLDNVTTASNVFGDRGGNDSGGGSDTIIIGGGSVIGGAVSGEDDGDVIVINGGSRVNGIGYRTATEDFENSADRIIVNNGIIDINQSGTAGDTSDDYGIYMGAGTDDVGLFGGTINGTIYMGDGADDLYIDPFATSAGDYGALDNETFDFGSGNVPLINNETNSLTINTLVFDGGDESDQAEIYNARSTASASSSSGSALVFQDNTVWTDWYTVTLDNSEMDIADSTTTFLRLTNSSTLFQRDGALVLADQAGSLTNSRLQMDETSVLDMQDGATDDYILVNSFEATDGSIIRVDVDVSAVGYDADASDYIAGASPDKPNASSATTLTTAVIDANLIGTASVSGARRIIDDTDLTDLDVDPGAGATPDPSTDYSLLVDPSTTARSYWLQDEGAGGVYLLWTTNITGETTAGFVGGGSSSSGPGSNPGAEAAAYGVALTEAPMAINGNLAAMARADALPTLLADDIDGPQAHDEPKVVTLDENDRAGDDTASKSGACGYGSGGGLSSWADLDYRGGNLGSSDYEATTARAGFEADIGAGLFDNCGRVIAGLFGYFGTSEITAENQAVTAMDTYGGGGYVRFSNAFGMFGSVLAHAGKGLVDASNPVLGSTASYDGKSYGAAVNFGQTFAIARGTVADIRTYANWTGYAMDRFTDSMGLAVAGIDGSVLTLGAELGIEHKFAPATTAFARAGVKWTDAQGDVVSSGSKVAFGTDYVSGTSEIGLSHKLTDRVSLTMTGFGEFAEDTALFGGRARLKISF